MDFIRQTIYPLAHFSNYSLPKKAAGRVWIPVEMESGKIRYLDSIHHIAPGKKPSDRTVILFHGNGMVCHYFTDIQHYFLNHSYNTLAYTLGGYPGSQGVSPTEESNYQDIEAAKQYLAKMGVQKAGYYGISLGGAMALQAGAGESTTDISSLFVIVDQTFSSIPQVGRRVIENQISSLFASCAEKILECAFPQGTKIFIGKHIDGKKLYTETDGLNNVIKAAKLGKKNIPLFVLKASHDAMMSKKEWTWSGGNRTAKVVSNFGDHLIEACYSDPKAMQENQVTIKGGHCVSFLDQKHAHRACSAFLKKV